MRRRNFIQSAVISGAALSVLPRRTFAAFQQAPALPPSVNAITGDGAAVTLQSRALADLRAKLRGRLLLAGNPGYDDARRILNPSFDKRPALVVQPTGVADIRAAIDFARENRGLLVAVKCGGHSYSGLSTCDRGMLIDLSLFRAVRVDPKARHAWATGGSLLGSIDHETAIYDLVTTLGTVSHTGVGGLVTGGGFGRVARRFGMAVDNLLSVDVVTADGQFRHANAVENADLFWGVRGGGGNFGIVTNFEFQLHPMQRQVVFGQLMFPFAKARDVFTLFGDYIRTCPNELDFEPTLVQPPGGAPAMAGFRITYSGAASGAERALAPLRKLGTPISDTMKTMAYTDVQKSGDISDPRAMASYLKAGFISNVTPDFVSAIVSGFKGNPARFTALFIPPGGGAIARVAPNATAFSQRDVIGNVLCVSSWPSAQNGAEHIAYTRQYWATLEKFTHGFYVNDLLPDATAAAIAANYRVNNTRLVQVKNKYDPKNLFRLNANVKPTV